MRHRLPELLTNDQYMNLSSSFRIFKNQIRNIIDVHCHEFYELAFVTSGSGVQKINGVESPIVKGSIFLLTPADFHEIVPDKNAGIQLYNLIFTSEMLHQQLMELLFSVRHIYTHHFEDEEYERMLWEWERIWDEAQISRVGSQLIVRGAIERVLIDLFRQCSILQSDFENRTARNTTDAIIRSSTIFIQHRFRESISLEQVAKHYNLSPNYFSGCFKQVLGVSFQTYVVNTRLEFAKSLIRVSNLSVTEVCLSSGFNTLAHFERMFKKKFGVTPKEYRATHSS
ncbi:AraC family transcriptional regulator [Paenibacillus mendelii]|uniref:AraC family transcriptional regulator n=1 Tax=Paenibacillus mendelii TaxID=206163 RepID=A0ABV6J7Y7_9BACL|nr:AraC family transcriptional regulator [Paenibacillus mendelii]MCQ6561348.1 AraC family transcriptional regulator [Paenibacillus mendelii]